MIYDFRKTSKAKYREWYDKGKREHCFEEEYQKHNRWTVVEFKGMCESVGFETLKVERHGNYWLFYIGKKWEGNIKRALSLRAHSSLA
jgi:hypothetical protein